MIHKTSTAHMTREEWLEARKHSVGGSEIGAILGLNRFQTALTVWSNKTGRLPDAEDNEAMRQGRDLEAYVAERFCELTGKRVKRNNYIMTNDDFPHLHANVDRLVIGELLCLSCCRPVRAVCRSLRAARTSVRSRGLPQILPH